MTRAFAGMLALLTGAAAATGYFASRRHTLPPPQLTLDSRRILANGNDFAALRIETRASGTPRITLLENPSGVAVEDLYGSAGQWQAKVRSGVMPGRVRFRVAIAGARPAFGEFLSVPDWHDSLDDGTPDFLRLDDQHDREAFRRWFTFLAEAQYFQAAANRPAEIDDCAALIRYAYREALHVHDDAWTGSARLPLVPPFDSVAKYQYPHTLLGAALFRVRPGPLRPADAADGAFAQFADAEALWRWNCHLVSRQLSAAQPGDLLFYRQLGRESFHSMIYLGPSQIANDGKRYLVYHTGPDGSDPGEIRRPTVDELMQFPRSEWRPLASNPNFLGVYRWNIMCSAGTN
ncbi:MAG TPA: DUF1175 family protein [Bryobacteraceae bacterium]|jgi:hypothetical protein|nr:DUF1175 family protein [Bryobacteraceae bacterium]